MADPVPNGIRELMKPSGRRNTLENFTPPPRNSTPEQWARNIEAETALDDVTLHEIMKLLFTEGGPLPQFVAGGRLSTTRRPTDFTPNQSAYNPGTGDLDQVGFPQAASLAPDVAGSVESPPLQWINEYMAEAHQIVNRGMGRGARGDPPSQDMKDLGRLLGYIREDFPGSQQEYHNWKYPYYETLEETQRMVP